MPQIKNNQTLTLKILRLGINGEGIAKHQGLTIFVPLALPQEKVLVKIKTVFPKYAQATIIKIIKTSPHRLKPACPKYEQCGGCQLQHLDYPQQINFKADLIKQSLAKFKPKNYQNYQILTENNLTATTQWHYRNKAQFQLGTNKDRVVTGLFSANSHRLVPLKKCLIQDQLTQKIINNTTKILTKLAIPIYNERKKSGILRTMVVRTAQKNTIAQVTFVTTQEKIPHLAELIHNLTQKCPEIVSIMQNINSKKTSLIFGKKTNHLWGRKKITEMINQVQFDLSATSFFQLNPQQTALLYQEAIKALDLAKGDLVIDAYCGVGTIGLSLANQVKEMRGMDITAEAIADAKINAQALGLTNTTYQVGKAELIIPRWIKAGFKATVMIVDPPRLGLDEQLIKTIINYPPQKICYISCNPSTLARDLVKLTSKFQVKFIKSIDMFPQTARVECFVLLTVK